MTSAQPALRHYLGVLKRQWWLIVVVVVISCGVALALTTTQEPVHRASMTIVVGQGGGVFQPQFGNVVQPFTQTMTNLLESEVVARTVISNLELTTTPEKLLEQLHVSARPDSSVLQISFDSANKQYAVGVLREVGDVFTELVRRKLGARGQDLEREGLAPLTATVFDPAHLEAGTVGPQPSRSVVLAAALGLAIGIVLAFLRDSLDKTIRGRREAEDAFGAPVVGEFPKGMVGRPPFGIRGRLPPKRADLVRAPDLLRANLQFVDPPSGALVLVTSALPNEGKSTVTANLGVALAMAGQHVICVEADVRRPRLESYLGVDADGDAGLVDVLSGRVALDGALRRVTLAGGRLAEHALVGRLVPARSRDAPASQTAASPDVEAAVDGAGSLRVLVAGVTLERAEPSLNADQLRSLAGRLQPLARYVIFDSPPLLSGAEAFPLLAIAGKVIVVAREGRTPRGAATVVRETLERFAVPDVSVVLVEASSIAGAAYY